MKTHEVARVLVLLARALKAGPDVPLADIGTSGRPPRNSNAVDAAMSLTALLDLSRFDKQQWIDLIKQQRLPITISPKDSSRNVIGKLVSYLEGNPAALEQLRQTTKRRASEASPELLRAFSVLLEDRR